MRSRDKAVPTPKVAFTRNKPLSCLQARGEPGSGVSPDDSDLRETPRKLRRGLDVTGQRFGAVGQRRIATVAFYLAPVHGGGGVNRGVEIVTERGA